MKKIFYKISCSNLGDSICATPVIRKLSNLYKSQINIICGNKDVFKNNPYVQNIFHFEEFQNSFLQSEFEFFESFVLPGQKNQFGIERKFNTFDIRQIHAIDLGFMLMPEELHCDFFPSVFRENFNLPDKYVVLHTAKNWPNRTWPQENWQTLIDYFKEKNIFTVLIGKNTVETESHVIEKTFYNFSNLFGSNLINKTSINDCWHIINNSRLFISFDTGPLHLAGTTDAKIVHLGSAKDPRLIAPYRKGSQNYKYNYIHGSCSLFCTNNLKYSVKEWNSINSVPPLIGCLENKISFECQPSAKQIISFLENYDFDN